MKGRRGEAASSWRRMQEMKKDWKRLAFGTGGTFKTPTGTRENPQIHHHVPTDYICICSAQMYLHGSMVDVH